MHVKLQAHLNQFHRLYGADKSPREPQLQVMYTWGIHLRDCVLVYRTGGGKTASFAVTATLTPGITIVVLPLLSLIEDMRRTLLGLGVRCVALHSGMDADDIKRGLEDIWAAKNFVNILLVTPEMVANNVQFVTMVRKLDGCGCHVRWVIDEAQCIVFAGDHRRAYRHLFMIKREFPRHPLLALTGTATRAGAFDIARALQLRSDAKILIFGTSRPEISLAAERRKGAAFKVQVEHLMAHLEEKTGPGIVFCSTTKTVDKVFRALQASGRVIFFIFICCLFIILLFIYSFFLLFTYQQEQLNKSHSRMDTKEKTQQEKRDEVNCALACQHVLHTLLPLHIALVDCLENAPAMSGSTVHDSLVRFCCCVLLVKLERPC